MPNKITITIGTDGTSVIEAYCLATNSWNDFEYFLAEATVHLQNGSQRAANREMRAALLCLFAHLEGVIGNIIRANKSNIENIERANTLCDKTTALTKEVGKEASVPELNFRLGKYLRDIIVHPGIEKTFGGETIDDTAVFSKLNIESLTQLSTRISAWLDCMCRHFGTERFTDTESMVREFADVLGTDYVVEER